MTLLNKLTIKNLKLNRKRTNHYRLVLCYQ